MNRRKPIVIVTLIVAVAILSSVTVTAFAFTGYDLGVPATLQNLFSLTNTYNCTSVDESARTVTYDLENRRNAQVMDNAQITVLTPGMGCSASVWSNLYAKDNADASFGYDEDSIINKIREKAGDANVYWAKMTGNIVFKLVNITNQNNGKFSDSNEYLVKNIIDISKHIIVLFEPADSNGSNDSVYFEFNYMLSKIIYDVTALNGGILPKVNLIGHSRGGLTNMQYALDHPDIVDSLISFGTPYFGSTTAKLWGAFHESDALTSILDPAVFSDYSKRWNDNYERLYKNINAVALGGYSSLPFLAEAVKRDISDNDILKTDDDKETVAEIITAVYAFKLASGTRSHLLAQMISELTDLLERFYPSSYALSLAEIILQEVNFDAHPPFVSWYNDICVNLDSQLAKNDLNINGGYTYKGFSRRTRYFTNGDGTDFYKVAQKNVPVPHNLEPRDAQMIKWAVDEIDVGFGRANGFTYVENENGSLNIDGFVGQSLPSMVIPDKIDGKTVTEIAPYAFDGILDGLQVTAVYLPDTIKKIGESAFAGNKLLQTVSLQNSCSLNTIGTGAFAGCENLNAFTIPQTVTELGASAFYGCNSISEYDIAEGNAKYVSLNGVIYSKGQNNSVGSTLIAYPIGRTEQVFNVPNGVEEICDLAFYGSKLQTINLNGVRILRSLAFANCEGLINIDGDNLQYIDLNALHGTAWLNNKIEQSQEFISLGQALYCYNGTDENIVLDDYVSVAPMAFSCNGNVKTVTIGNSITTIGELAFYGCQNLKTAYLNSVNNIVYAGLYTFDGNSSDRKIYVPECLQQEYANNEIWQKYNTTVHQTALNYNLFGGVIEDGAYAESIGYGGFFALPEPTKEHHTFGGWYADENCVAQQVVDGEQWLSYDSDLTLYAKWIPANYTIVLDLQDEMQTKQMFNYIYGQIAVLPTVERVGYLFDGWFFDKALTQSAGSELNAETNGDFTLYAKWKAKTYVVTYNLDYENAGEIATTTVTYDQPYSLRVVSRDKYFFNGWKSDNETFYCSQDGSSNFLRWKYDGDITLKADWTGWSYYIEISYDGTVTWVTGEGGFSSSESTLEYGKKLESPDKLAELFNPYEKSLKEGYRFKYFVKSRASTEPIKSWDEFDDQITEPNCKIEIFPFFLVETGFTLNFVGYVSRPGTNPFVSTYDEKITYLKPEKNGYTFQYWQVAGLDVAEDNSRFVGTRFAPGSKFDYAKMPDLSVGYEKDGIHIYLVPYFTPNSYIVTLHTAYGALNSARVSVVFGEKQSLGALQTAGRTFNGWYTAEPNKTRITDSNGNMINSWQYAQDKDLYADWTTNQYSVNYIYAYTNNNRTSFTVDDLSFSLNDPTRSGYRFMGWYTSDSYETRVYSISTVGSRTLYAKWSKLFAITFNGNGGTSCASKQGITGENIVLPTSVKGGYKGKWLKSGSSVAYEFGAVYTIGASDTAFTASWTEKTTKECYNQSTYTYEIYTYNQLNGIRNLGRSGNPETNYLIVDISLKNDITIPYNWVPIDACYKGTFNGNYHSIKDMNIEISKEGDYGLFTKVEQGGTVKNLNFVGVKITNNITDDQYTQKYSAYPHMCVGIVAGYCTGNISNCNVSSGSIKVTIHKSYVGGIVGFSSGKIYNCKNKWVDVSGYGILGGIVGGNGAGNVNLCHNYADVTYTYYKESGCSAGIVGKNMRGGAIESCKNSGTIGYGGNYAWNAYNRPCMAQIVGWNVSGTLYNNTCAGKCSFSNMTSGQKTYCKDGEVGRTGE